MYVVSFRCEILNSTDPEQDRKRRSAWPAYLLRWLNHFETGYWTSGMGSIYLVKEAGQWRIAVDPQEIAKIQLQSLRMFQTGEPQLITTRPASPLRPAPDSNSPESGRLDLGSCLQRFDQPEDSEFCKVRDDQGRVGWVAVKDTREIGPGGVQDAALAIIRAYLDDPANKDKPCLEVEHTIDKLKQGPGFDRIGRIELEFYRLLAIHRTGVWLFESGQDPQNPETNAWLKKHERLIGTSYYAVHPNNFWRLEALLPRNQSLQEKIAFTAATLYFPRECETLPTQFCIFWSELDQKGEYLRRHPTGAHAKQVLDDLKKELGEYPPASQSDLLDLKQRMGTDSSERERTNHYLSEWRDILGKVPACQDRDAILANLECLERMMQEAGSSQPPV